jgi:hypothetical protein
MGALCAARRKVRRMEEGFYASLSVVLCATKELSSPMEGGREGKRGKMRRKRSVDSHGATGSARTRLLLFNSAVGVLGTSTARAAVLRRREEDAEVEKTRGTTRKADEVLGCSQAVLVTG